ncbi:uncharacterized protein LOC133033999 [Cannabis sativa]|uniref:uncharacterized protein LOC133033999 n=1 Tax=Cannabis sativa TaxID=3483 RepID=UPI0029CAA126|nr:uncharacterized protein LOC133033999 [Cannabis sativa]
MEENGSFGGVEPYWKNKRPLELELEGNQKNDDDELSNTLIMNEGIISSLPLWKKAHLMDYFSGGSSSNGAPSKAFNTTTTINNSSTNTLFSALINENQGPRADEFPSFCNTKESLDNRANDHIQFRYGHNIDPNMDPRKIKRIISNRASAQRSRWKKIQYISDMENTVRALKSQISSLSPRVALYTKEHQLLQLEHTKLTHQISVYTNQELLGQVEFEKNKAEVNRLRVLYFKQQQQQLHIQQQYHHYFQAPSLPHHEEYLSMNQIMPNYFNNQPTQIFPHYPDLDVEFGCNNINGATGNYNLIQDQSTRSQMVSNTTLQYDVDDSDHVQDQTGQSWTTTTTNFIEEPKQHDHDIETDIQFYNNHFGSIPEYA